MEIPWELLLKLAGGSALLAFVMLLALIFSREILKSGVETVAKRFESSFARAEQAYKKMLELKSEIDLDLRNRREKPYRELWNKTRLLPKWPRSDDVTYEKLDSFRKELRDWYFDGGGIYLSSDSMDAYKHLQDTISDVLKVEESRTTQTIRPKEYDDIRERCSELRSQMTNDLVSRRAAPHLEESKAS
jgi:hypothetical protein